MIKKMISILFTMIIMLTILCLSTQDVNTSLQFSEKVTEKIVMSNDASIKKATYNMRNIAHFALFLILGISMTTTVKLFNPPLYVFISTAICFLYAVFDEVYQELLNKGRKFEFVDLLKDWSGALVGVLLTLMCMFLIYKRRKSNAFKA